jgi:hypothetical protein
MKLTTLKSKLLTLDNTDIAQVVFDQNKYLANVSHQEKSYPLVVWCFNNAKYKADHRSSTIQKIEIVTMTVFIIEYFDHFTEDEDRKLDIWDKVREYFTDYINMIDQDSAIQVVNIADLKGQYIPEGVIDQNKEIGIMYEVELRLFCNA